MYFVFCFNAVCLIIKIYILFFRLDLKVKEHGWQTNRPTAHISQQTGFDKPLYRKSLAHISQQTGFDKPLHCKSLCIIHHDYSPHSMRILILRVFTPVFLDSLDESS